MHAINLKELHDDFLGKKSGISKAIKQLVQLLNYFYTSSDRIGDLQVINTLPIIQFGPVIFIILLLNDGVPHNKQI